MDVCDFWDLRGCQLELVILVKPLVLVHQEKKPFHVPVD